MKKIIVIISLLMNVVFLMFFSAFTIERGGLGYIYNKIEEILSSNKSDTEEFSAKYHGRKSIFEVLPKEENEIIFLGCSITEQGEWNEMFDNPKIKNRGIGGDGTLGVINRLDEIVEAKPKKIFVKIGTNDLRKAVPLETIISNLKTIVEMIRTESPSTQIYLKSILPVNNELFGNKINNKDIIELNKRIFEIAEQNYLVYIDLHSHFANSENQLGEHFTFDGIHLNGRGYLLWKSLIEEYVH